MNKKQSILIVGAGPSGLALAIFLHDLGFHPRIIDKKTEVSPFSKALGVNPRTLEILEQFKVAEAFLKNGRILKAVNLWKGDKHLFRNNLEKIQHKYAFMLIQPQKESEEILARELEKRNIEIEFGTQFESYEQKENSFRSIINSSKKEEYESDFIVGADGAHSFVRKQEDISYKGFRYADNWELYDIEIDTKLPPDEAHIRIFKEGGMLLFHMKDTIWRVAGNMHGLLNYLPSHAKPGKIHWESKFFITHNLAERLTSGNIALIGDAAHLHSPVGGRGMNLGIEDAYLLSKLLKQGRFSEYSALRKPYLEKTVKRINNMTQLIGGQSSFRRFLRGNVGLMKPFFSLAAPAMRNFMAASDAKDY